MFDVRCWAFDVLSLFPIKNPKSSIENHQSTPLPMGFPLTRRPKCPSGAPMIVSRDRLYPIYS